MDVSDDSDADHEGSPAKAKVKRGRALLRQATDDEHVPFVTHATSAAVVKEFMYELKSQWAIFGTPEAGVAARGSLALKHPAVMFANNDVHEEVLRAGLEAGIVESCLAGGDFSSKTLVAAWQAAQDEMGSDSSSSSGGETSGQPSESHHTEEEEEGKKEPKKHDKKGKKDKKKSDKDDKKKIKKKDKKKEKKKDKKKKEKEHKQSGKAKPAPAPAPSASSGDVMKALIGNETGTKS